MTDRKMSDEEVFVSAMNAAITGLMSAHGDAIFDLAKSDMQHEKKLCFALCMIDEVVQLSSEAGRFAVLARDNFKLEIDGE